MSGILADKARQANAALAAMQLLLERDRRATVLGSLAAAAAKLGSPLNAIAVISRDDMKAALKEKLMAMTRFCRMCAC